MHKGILRALPALVAAPLAILASTAPALAAATTTNDVTIQKNVNDFGETCTAGLIAFTGTEKFTFHRTDDAANGIHQFFLDVVASGTGFDAMGVMYTFGEHSSNTFNIPGPPDSFNITIRFDYRAIRQGEPSPPLSMDDMILHSVFHFTFDANGVPTAQVTHDNPTPVCN
jgi:hypothetical protein